MNVLDMIQKNEGYQIPDEYYTLSTEEMEKRVKDIKERLGDALFIPGHHYQKEEVVVFSDSTGDSLQLAQVAANNKKARYIVFCGVHFMAETADILTEDEQIVILPDMRAGCSMADMADHHQTDRAWVELQKLFGDTILPLTYVNSTAAIKAFVGRNDGATVTSSNAKKVVSWAFTQKERILFLPDQHLGRNTAFDLGVPLEHMAIWNPITDTLEYEGDDLNNIKVILWKGHCSVHENFTVGNVHETRSQYPNMTIIVHPECRREVVELSDMAGSTSYIINAIEKAAPGTEWAIGTEMNLVNRLIKDNPDKKIISLNPQMCPCLTMNRIDLPHLVWSLDTLENTNNTIKVPADIAENAKLALDRMLKNA